MNTQVIGIAHQNLPAGYQVRPATLDDLAATVATLNAAYEASIGATPFNVDTLAREWTEPGFNLESDSRLVFSPSGQVVGYYEVWDATEPVVRVMIWGQVHPDHRNRGLGTYLMKWVEERAALALDKAPNGARVVLHAFVTSVNPEARKLFENLGYRSIRQSWRMVIYLDRMPAEEQWPAGIRVRTLRTGQDEADVLHVVREAFKDHWGFVDTPFDQDFERWMHRINHDSEFDPSLWFLAMDGNQIAGVSLCRLSAFDDPQMGWVEILGVRRPWRRQGLALALLHHSFRELHARGKSAIGLGVDAQSLTGATRLYERAGMHPDPSHQFDLFEKELRPGYELSTQSIEG